MSGDTLTLDVLRAAAYRVQGIEYRCSRFMLPKTILLMPVRRMVVGPDIDEIMWNTMNIEKALLSLPDDTRIIALPGWEGETDGPTPVP